MDKNEFESILKNRIDVHPSMKEYHLVKMNNYCLHEPKGGPIKISGIEYHCICGEPKGHSGSHEDIEGGIWWDNEQ